MIIKHTAALCAVVLAAALGHAAAAPASPSQASWMLGPFAKADGANPILKPSPDTLFDCPMTKTKIAWEHDHVFNPAAVVRGGKVYILYRSEDNSGDGIGNHTSRIGLAESKDGLHFTKRPTPVLFPDEDDQKSNEWTGGCEDPRIVETDDGGYLLTYTQWNRRTARLASATSRDLIHWTKHGPVLAKTCNGKFLDVYCKSGAVVTRRKGDHLIAAKIDGKYWMYFGEGAVYAATSTNLTDWDPVLDDRGEWKPLLKTRAGHFDSALAESGPPAVITDKGIVFLYNGKNADANGDPTAHPGAYSGGQALFDAHDPTQLIERTDGCFITPERPYETSGQYAAGTVFIEGLVHFKKKWFLYYGTADSFVAAAVASE
ncbi:MAG: glycoside hydrolase family 130 protein [Capsulimonas sp.]|uniref:glycoside hydrolase family 130 protein n=1 Tax=Capsulimonas sp. TaxID=2494211 RepID=UPI003267E31B